jgi:hypothetical protein
VWKGGSGKLARVWEGTIRDYIYGCLGWWIGYCGSNACEVGFGDSIPGLVRVRIVENGPGVGRVGLGTINRALLFVDCGLWAGGVRRRDCGLYPGPDGWADRGKWPVLVGGQD